MEPPELAGIGAVGMFRRSIQWGIVSWVDDAKWRHAHWGTEVSGSMESNHDPPA